MLKIEHFTKSYQLKGKGAKKAVDDLTLEIAPGELCAFIGHNGAGKTTTLKACAGILQFTDGEITICGHSVKSEPLECKKRIAYIPDNPDLYSYMTGAQYIGFVADIFGISKSDRETAALELGERFGLSSELTKPIGEYSHGMKQKLALIAALMHKPELILMDEPFVGLDPLASHTLKTIMREHCERGGAIFFSTHVLEVAEKLCDKVAIIKDGRLIRYGEMDKVRGDSSLESIFLELAKNGDENAD